MKVTIADDEFLPYGKSAYLGGDNTGIGPTYFEWELADPRVARFVTDRNIKNASGRGQVAWLLESFFLHPENYLEAMRKPFGAVLTHNKYFAENLGWIWVPHGGSWVDLKQWGLHEKRKDISIIVSPKTSMPGHKLRHEVVKRYGDKCDVFGLDGYVHKYECLAPYRYSIVIEAEKCPGFFSEHLIDCLAVGTIPIYWGDHGYFGSKSIISVDGIQEIEGAIDYIYDVGESSYEYHLPDLKVSLDIARQYAICEDWIFAHHPTLFGER